MNLDTISRRLFQFSFISLAVFIPFSIAGASFAIGFGLLAWILAAVARRRGGVPPGENGKLEPPGDRRLLRDPLFLVSLLLAVSAIPSVIISSDFSRAFKDWRSYWLLLICLYTAFHMTSHRMREVTFWALFTSMTVACVVSFIQRLGGIDFWIFHIPFRHRPESTLYTMTFAGILYQTIILCFAMALRKGAGWRVRLLLWSGLAMQFLAILLTVTRGAWVALFMGLAAVCFLVRSKTVIAVSAALIMGIFVFPLMVPKDHQGRNVNPLLLFKEVDIHAGTRLILWDVSWDMFKKNPVFGVGMGDYSDEAEAMLGERKVTTTTDTHNVYMHLLATRGLVGFLPFVLFWIVMFRSLFDVKRQAVRGSPDWSYAVGAIGATVAVLFGALTENNVDDEEVFIAYMLIAGLALSAVRALRPPSGPRP